MLLLDELYAAVLGASGIGLVVGNGFVRALTHGTEVETITDKTFESLHHCLGTLL